MTRSVRWPFGFFNWLREQKRIIQRIPQSNRGGNIAFQVSNHAGNHGDISISQRNVSGHHECYADYSIQMAQAGRSVEINDGQWSGGQNKLAVCSFQYSGLAGALAHDDGSFSFFKWDGSKGRMIDFDLSTPFMARFYRAASAFIRSWRLG